MRDGERFVILLRHGIAEERSADKPESERALTAEGHSRMDEIARGLARLAPKAGALVSSPLARCVQTAEWVARAYDDRLSIETSPLLAPESDVRKFRELLDSVDAPRAIFVGHEPNLTLFMLALTGTQSDGGIDLKKGGCYGIRIGARNTLEWLLPPRALRLSS
jgi:phosphohistidine phosphatase